MSVQDAAITNNDIKAIDYHYNYIVLCVYICKLLEVCSFNNFVIVGRRMLH